MKLTRPKTLLVAGVAVSLALLVGITCLFKLPPFEEKGEIEASEVCASLGSASGAADSLRKVLPEESSYSFDDDVTSRVDDTDTGYESSCFVSGGGDQLLVAKSQLMTDESAQDWTEWVKGTAANTESVASLTPFAAGKQAVASGRFAAVFVPCTAEGKIPGGQYNISVSVELKQPGGASASSNRAELIELAKSAASYAHTRAKCGMPLDLA